MYFIEDMKKDNVFAGMDLGATNRKKVTSSRSTRKDVNLLNFNSRREQLLKKKRQKMEITNVYDESREHPINVEVRRLLKTEPIDAMSNPLKWYKENSSNYPLCAKFYAHHGGAQATSVKSERIFNKAGLVYDPNRSCLQAEKAEKLVYLCECFQSEDGDHKFTLCEGCKPQLKYKLCCAKHRNT